ncbi:hypothetical protein [Psychrobacter sp. Pi2-52]|uniref:hypothetical protein n=1 Tax=Psychrobacter sp. Pi2-52 TaxID=2774133 RepID=UPI00191AE3F7|nr:hypothetical protein [Psychrobacter sp. Pi2-52]
MKYKRIIIESAKLNEIIERNYPKHIKNTWTLFSILIALIVTFISVDKFKDFSPYVSSFMIEKLLMLSIIIFIFLIIWELSQKPKNSKESVLSEINQEALNVVRNVALFILIKDFNNEDSTKDTKILFSDDIEWSSYLLPYCKLNHDFTMEELSRFIEYELSLPSHTITLRKIDELCFVEEKNSATSSRMTQYNYSSYYVVYEEDVSPLIQNKEFKLGTKKYEWLSLQEVQNHAKTMYLNRKVIDEIHENWPSLLLKYKISKHKK